MIHGVYHLMILSVKLPSNSLGILAHSFCTLGKNARIIADSWKRYVKRFTRISYTCSIVFRPVERAEQPKQRISYINSFTTAAVR